jgi:arylsulfatase A-like enzyme
MCRLFQLAGLLLAGSLALATEGQPPNVLLIAVDDMGYDTPVSFGGRVEGLTPHIDSLASQGMSFTRAFNTSSRCAPSRGSIIPGITRTTTTRSVAGVTQPYELVYEQFPSTCESAVT